MITPTGGGLSQSIFEAAKKIGAVQKAAKEAANSLSVNTGVQKPVKPGTQK